MSKQKIYLGILQVWFVSAVAFCRICSYYLIIPIRVNLDITTWHTKAFYQTNYQTPSPAMPHIPHQNTPYSPIILNNSKNCSQNARLSPHSSPSHVPASARFLLLSAPPDKPLLILQIPLKCCDFSPGSLSSMGCFLDLPEYYAVPIVSLFY